MNTTTQLLKINTVRGGFYNLPVDEYTYITITDISIKYKFVGADSLKNKGWTLKEIAEKYSHPGEYYTKDITSVEWIQ